jgi:hypothetical protein
MALSNNSNFFEKAGTEIGSPQQHTTKTAKRSYRDGVMANQKEVDTNDIAHSGLVFQEKSLRVLPCKAIGHENKITRIKLTHLPMYTKEKVLKGLQESFSSFGRVIDIGLYTERQTGFYMGTGYAVLAQDPTDECLPLDHNVYWGNSQDVFHCNWNHMPTTCNYCHEAGHNKYDCEKSKARIIFHRCKM